MKSIACVLFALALAACEKPNDVAELQTEANAVAKYYAPKVEDLQHRVNAIKAHGQVPANTTGTEEANKRFKEAEDKLHAIQTVLAPGADHKSAIEHKAETLAKASDLMGLEELIDDSREQLEQSTTMIDDRLESVESWVAQAQASAPLPVPPPPPPAPQPL